MWIIRNQGKSWVLGLCLLSLYLCHLFRAMLASSIGNDWKRQEYHRALAPQYALAYLYVLLQKQTQIGKKCAVFLDSQGSWSFAHQTALLLVDLTKLLYTVCSNELRVDGATKSGKCSHCMYLLRPMALLDFTPKNRRVKVKLNNVRIMAEAQRPCTWYSAWDHTDCILMPSGLCSYVYLEKICPPKCSALSKS